MWITYFFSSLLRFISVVFYGEITTDFKPCIEFFYAETIPQGISGDYQALCQHYENQYHFATLYDRNRRIPLFSAYILSPGDGPRPKNTNWMIEPRLVSDKVNTGMEYQKHPDQNVKNSQAVNEDYKHSGYTRGHLAPSGHQQTEEDKEATFTLTNIAPQMEKFNNGPWNNLEDEMAERFKVCTSKMYVITGVMPYEKDEPKINNRVTVPEYFWTAYCCPTFTAGPDQNYFPTYAAVGRNDPNSKDDIVKKNTQDGHDVKEMSLEDLEKILQNRLKMPEMSLFKNKCKE
ncbi:endonuclease domain-containing 1 protein-like [Simochromis diagramma]|uniref:endonuclease domain-containing 1 protein-like n=1 Tax=Simochromis diagramma TaxID=43689 RepID=UPI001A7E43B2|nr:endonuclease domain-containing 1 protein-like [Simochromis diagramma]